MAGKTTATNPVLKVPGVESASLLPSSPSGPGTQGIAIFVPGVDAFRDIQGGEVTLECRDSSTATAVVTGTKAGRLYSLSNEFMGQSPAALLGSSQAGNYSFSDVIHFKALADTFGDKLIGPLEIYTVVQVRVPYTMPNPALPA